MRQKQIHSVLNTSAYVLRPVFSLSLVFYIMEWERASVLFIFIVSKFIHNFSGNGFYPVNVIACWTEQWYWQYR